MTTRRRDSTPTGAPRSGVSRVKSTSTERCFARGARGAAMKAGDHGGQSRSAGDRPRRHQDGNHRARSGRPRAFAPSRRNPSRRLRGHDLRGRGARARRRARARRPRHGGHRDAGLDFARDRPAPRLQLGVAQRPRDPRRPRSRARARGPHHQRRQLLRAVGGERRRGAGRRRRLRGDPRHRRWRGHRRRRARARGRQRHRGRVGPQSAALAAG